MNSLTSAQAGNILVFRIGQMGDTLVSLPAIRAIREHHPHHHLVLLTERQETASFVSSWEVLGPTGWFADVVFYRTARGVLGRLFTLLTLSWRLRRLRCEMVYDLTPERKLTQGRRDRFFFKRVIGIRDYRGGGYLTKPDKNAAGVLPKIEPEWKRLLRAAGAEMPVLSFHLSIPEDERRKAQELLVRAGIPAGFRLLGVGPGSKMPSKVWPLERFREVGSRFLQNYPDCMLLVVGGHDDVARGEELCSAWGPRAHNLAGKLSLYGSAEVLRQCVAYVGNDTGAMHLAGMVGIPCVALFSARDYPGQWEPYGTGHIVLRHETECAGCMRTRCPYENKCLNMISIDEVEKAVNSFKLFSGTAPSSDKSLERLGKKSARMADRKLTLHVLGQTQPYLNDLAPRTAGPDYFADMVYQHAASLLGLDVKNHIAGDTRSIFRTLWLSLMALKTIKNSGNKLVIVWQGYGTYAVLASTLLGRKTRFILNTYKVPSDRPQALKKRINDKLLGKAISTADGVIAISRSQVNALKPYNSNVVWIPFASDSNWWTPGFPDHALLASHGIGYRDYILIMGDVDRDERTTLKAVRDLNHPILRVTRERRTAHAAQRAFRDLNITQGDVLVNVPFELLRELYRGARVVVVPARSSIHPAGMTSMTEAMSCGRPVVMPSGLATDGYVQDGYDAFVLNEWEEFAIRDRVAKIYQTDIGESVGRNARNTVEERINFHASARKLADFIASLSAAGNVPRKINCG